MQTVATIRHTTEDMALNGNTKQFLCNSWACLLHADCANY